MQITIPNRSDRTAGYGYFDPRSFSSALAVLKAHGEAGAQYLAHAVEPNGQFIYEINAKTGRISTRYNILRHAGAMAAMIIWARRLQSEALKDPIARARSHLFSHLTYDARRKSACIAISGEAKLGGTALALLAELALSESNNPAEQAIRAQLGAHLLAQRDDAGLFQSVARVDGKNARPFSSAYYPWQAILALSHLAETTESAIYLDAAIDAAKFYLKSDTIPLEPVDRDDHWTIIALNQIDRICPHISFARRVIAGATRIIDQVFAPGTPREATLRQWNYPCAGAATRVEALIAACSLATRYGLTDIAESFHFHAGVLLVHCTKYRAADDSAPRVLGGFIRSPSNSNIRIDTVQHVLSAIDGFLSLSE